MLTKKQPTLTVVFENVHDPHNVSAVIRTCDAVGVLDVHGIYYGRNTFPELGKKSSSSARKWVDVHLHQNVDDCYGALREQGFSIYSTHISNTSTLLYDLDLTKPCALVFGNEHDGVSADACEKADANFIIPQVGVIKSLNISVACAVALYEAHRQRLQAGMYDVPQLTPEQLEAKKDDWFSR